MKTTLSIGFAFLALASAHAQVFRPSAGNRTGGGDAAAAGRHIRPEGPREGSYVYRQEPRVHVGVSFGNGYYGRSGYHGRPYGDRGYGYGYGYYPSYSYYPSYGYYGGYGADYPYYGTSGYYGSGSGAANGLVLGALAGGIIGNNSGSHNGWRGAAWGAGLGWLLGSVADSNRRPVVYGGSAPVIPQAPVAQPAQSAAPAQPVTIINNYYNTSTPMSGANGLFGR